MSNPGRADLRPIVEDRKVDVILLSYDPIEYPDLPDLLKKAKEKGIGIVAMKVFTNARKAELSEFKSGLRPFHEAALRWVLQDPYVDCAITSMNVIDQIDEYIKVSGAKKRPSAEKQSHFKGGLRPGLADE